MISATEALFVYTLALAGYIFLRPASIPYDPLLAKALIVDVPLAVVLWTLLETYRVWQHEGGVEA